MKKIIILLTVVFSLISCSSFPEKGGLSPVYITNTNSVYLLPPNAIEKPVDSLQLLNGTFGETSFVLFVYFQADNSSISMSLLNDFGTDMGFLSFDGNSVEFDSSFFQSNLKAEYIICDIQNAYYNVEKLSENYKKAGLIFEERIEGSEKIREIRKGKKLIEQITISQNSIRIQNVLRGYEYYLTEGEE